VSAGDASSCNLNASSCFASLSSSCLTLVILPHSRHLSSSSPQIRAMSACVYVGLRRRIHACLHVRMLVSLVVSDARECIAGGAVGRANKQSAGESSSFEVPKSRSLPLAALCAYGIRHTVRAAGASWVQRPGALPSVLRPGQARRDARRPRGREQPRVWDILKTRARSTRSAPTEG